MQGVIFMSKIYFIRKKVLYGIILAIVFVVAILIIMSIV
ncbi:hypothetical protein L21TH_2231 [Caldisalinibacter kiritimatiensis]|uniref:Uncharacterized protein n=1 Tax=Caldisalinibacter kiritimatiensis TaxID=1304284 RepID=R1CSS1_9FIRM|nr:hypothetical protein L21TH_2231 [Caldisalinibacter kiritimatiensis]